MQRRSSHVGKSQSEQRNYIKFLRQLSTTPTAEDNLVFQDSDITDEVETVAVPPSSPTRPSSKWASFSDHLRGNTPAYIIAGIFVLLSIFLYNISGSIGRVQSDIEKIKEDARDNRQSLNDIRDNLHDQELLSNEQRIRLDYIQLQLDTILEQAK